jgi:hypothetical protein
MWENIAGFLVKYTVDWYNVFPLFILNIIKKTKNHGSQNIVACPINL